MVFEYIFTRPYMRYWLEAGKPHPEYSLYHFPAYVIGGVVEAMISYAELNTDKQATALEIAVKAAVYLISVSHPAGHPLEYLPRNGTTWQPKQPE